MRELGVLGHAEYKVSFMLDHRAMITVQTEKYGEQCLLSDQHPALCKPVRPPVQPRVDEHVSGLQTQQAFRVPAVISPLS